MPKLVRPLSVKQIEGETKRFERDASRTSKKLSDGKGLHLSLRKGKTPIWCFTFRLDSGKQQEVTFGPYPEVSLAKARELLERARESVREGVHPKGKGEAALAKSATFGEIAEQWLAKQKAAWKDKTYRTAKQRLEQDLLPALREVPIKAITKTQIVEIVRKVEARWVFDTARREKGLLSRIFQYAIASGACDNDPTTGLGAALAPAPKEKHLAAITDPKQVGALLRAIDAYVGNPIVRCALRLAPLVFVRPGELQHAEWSEVDLDGARWTIPARRMKMDREHLVPLSRQAVAILREVHFITGDGRFCFPSLYTSVRPISENTLNQAIRRCGFAKGEMTAHGFRTTASTLLNEKGYRFDWIECQLGHAPKNKVRDAYNRAEYLPERTRMMQEWADYLDELRAAK